MMRTGDMKDIPLLKALFYPMPIYTTREYGAEKAQATYTISFIFLLMSMLLVVFNVIGWGIYGLVELINKVV